MTTKRDIERRLEALEEEAAAKNDNENDRLEIHPDGLMHEPEPELTDALRALGFVVEREEQGNGNEFVRLHKTPSAGDLFQTISWHRGGPTANPNAMRIIWEDERREQVLADATYLVTYAEPDVPADPFLIDEGEGWRAVAPTDQVITKMVKKREDAEHHGFEILGPVDQPLADADKYDLVEVDADPDADRPPKWSDV